MPHCIVFFVSGHGFGHASRQVEVINAIGACAPDTRLILRTAARPDLLGRTLIAPADLRPGPCDTGVVQTNSVTHDNDATLREAAAFNATLDARADAEARALAGDDVAAVVGDIPPLAFEVAARLDVPSIAIGNFPWDWIYEDLLGPGATPRWLDRIRQAYARAMLALRLPFSPRFDVFPAVRDLPLIARHATRARDETRRHFGIPADRPAALLSFGGYGLAELDLDRVDCRSDWTLVTTDSLSAAGVHRHPPRGVVSVAEADLTGSGFRYEDVVAAVDVVVTKPGYGIVAECIAAGRDILYTSRGHFPEYDIFVRDMPRYLRCRFIEQADLFGGRWAEPLAALRQQPAAAETIRTNGAAIAAGIILDACAR